MREVCHGPLCAVPELIWASVKRITDVPLPSSKAARAMAARGRKQKAYLHTQIKTIHQKLTDCAHLLANTTGRNNFFLICFIDTGNSVFIRYHPFKTRTFMV
jgi:hypothetical protein